MSNGKNENNVESLDEISNADAKGKKGTTKIKHSGEPGVEYNANSKRIGNRNVASMSNTILIVMKWITRNHRRLLRRVVRALLGRFLLELLLFRPLTAELPAPFRSLCPSSLGHFFLLTTVVLAAGWRTVALKNLLTPYFRSRSCCLDTAHALRPRD